MDWNEQELQYHGKTYSWVQFPDDTERTWARQGNHRRFLTEKQDHERIKRLEARLAKLIERRKKDEDSESAEAGSSADQARKKRRKPAELTETGQARNGRIWLYDDPKREGEKFYCVLELVNDKKSGCVAFEVITTRGRASHLLGKKEMTLLLKKISKVYTRRYGKKGISQRHFPERRGKTMIQARCFPERRGSSEFPRTSNRAKGHNTPMRHARLGRRAATKIIPWSAQTQGTPAPKTRVLSKTFFEPNVGGRVEMNSEDTEHQRLVSRKPLNPRKALKVKRNRIRGRVNALRSELSQLEPALAKLEERLRQMTPEDRGNAPKPTH